jgi:hypothetical protein
MEEKARKGNKMEMRQRLGLGGLDEGICGSGLRFPRPWKKIFSSWAWARRASTRDQKAFGLNESYTSSERFFSSPPSNV